MSKKPVKKMAVGGQVPDQTKASDRKPNFDFRSAFSNAIDPRMRGVSAPRSGENGVGIASSLLGAVKAAAIKKADQSPAKGMKSGGAVRGCGCAVRGTKGAKSV